jgi:hypothetical protein
MLRANLKKTDDSTALEGAGKRPNEIAKENGE